MKQWILGIGGLLVAMLALAEEPEFRAFTAKDGRTLEARIVGHLPAKGQVQIERRTGKKIWVKPDIFSEADQAYIQSWLMVEQFADSLKVSTEEQDGHLQSIYYLLTLENRGNVDFRGLYMDYRMYLEASGSSRGRCVGGDQFIGSVEAGQTVEVKTYPQSRSGCDSEGIWLRIYGPEVDGERAMIEMAFPSGLMSEKSWEQKFYRPKVFVNTTNGGGAEYKEAMNFRYGKNGEVKDIQKAIELFEESAEKGTPKSYYWIGDIYYRGGDVEKDWAIAAEWFEKAIDAGWSSAGSWLGEMYMKGGNGLEKNEALALARWKDGADCEDQNCLKELTWYYGANRTASKRNGELAGEYADRMMACGVDYFLYTGSAAAAYAEAGRFDYAVYLQQKVVDYINEKYSDAKNDNYRAGFQKNLERFKRGEAIPTKD